MKKRKSILLLGIVVCLSVACKSKSNQVADSNSEAKSDNQIELVTEPENEGEKGELDTLLEQGNYWNNIPVKYTYYFTGKIDNKYEFDLYLEVENTTANGHYQYLNQSKSISFQGTLLGDKLKITEEDGHIFTGKFEYDSGRITGNWSPANGKRTVPFEMSNPYSAAYLKNSYKAHLKKDEDSRYTIEYIQVTDPYGQEVILSANTEAYDFAYGLFVQDYNFDGYLDISLVEFMPAYPPLKFKYFLFDSYGSYYETALYDDIYTLPDYINYRDSIVSLMVEGRHYSQSIYKYQNDRLYKIYSEYYSGEPADEDSYLGISKFV